MNYSIEIRCKDCGTTYKAVDPNLTIQTQPGTFRGRKLEHRGALIWFTENCPEYHNLKVIDGDG